MPRGAGSPRGVPARLACLLLLALIAVVCLATGADAKKKPEPCPTNPDGSAACNSCVKKNCKWDDRCFFDKAEANTPSSPGSACSTAATKRIPDTCRGIQRKHGKRAPASVSANGVGGKQGKRARCLSATAPQNNNTSVPCACATKNGKEAKKGCKFCVPATPISPCTDGLNNGTSTNSCPIDVGDTGDSPPGPAPPPPPASPPPPPSDSFLLNNLMTMQGGAVKYTPSTSRGNWTTLCQIPQAAKAIAVGVSQTTSTGATVPATSYILNVWQGTEPVPGLSALYADKPTSYNAAVLNQVYNYMQGTTYFENAAKWYVEGLPKSSSGASQGGLAPPTYTGTGKDYLDSYFKSGIQATATTTAASGSSDVDANGQILMKTSAYWVAATHVMYNLDMAEKNLAANKTAEAKANFDSAAAAYFGCGDTNPVPFPNPPQAGQAPIAYSATAGSPDTGFNATTMSIYGVANKRADNYGALGLVSTTGGVCTVAGVNCKQVAALNVAVGTSLSAGPSTANIATVRDAVLIIFTQAAQRYVAKVTLDAHLPGNGMGGSTNPGVVTSSKVPISGSYIPADIGGNVADKKQPTACGGKTSYIFTAANAGGCGAATKAADNAGGVNNGGTVGSTGCRKVSGVGACSVTGDVPVIGSPESNTATFGSIQAEVKSVKGTLTAGNTVPSWISGQTVDNTVSLPYRIQAAAAVAATVNVGGGNTMAEVTLATRGKKTGTVSALDAPIACVGPDVTFSDITTCGKATACAGQDAANKRVKGLGLRLCVPNGLIPPAGVTGAAATLAGRVAGYSSATGAPGIEKANDENGAANSGFWDPVTVAMATKGAFCCDALVYSAEGVGRPATDQAALPKDMVPPMVGGDMVAATSPGTMYDGSSSVTGLSEIKNPDQVDQLEGQAFYAVMAPMQYTLQTTSTTASVQKARADKQKVCAETLLQMLVMSRTGSDTSTCQGLKDCDVAAGAAPNTAPFATTSCVNNNPAAGTAIAVTSLPTTQSPLTNCRGTAKNAINFPLWMVGIGGNDAGTTAATDYVVPNGYCYANACFEDFAEVGTQSAFAGKTKLKTLIKSPDMASAPTAASPKTSAGRANGACKAPPATWTGGAVEMKKCSATVVGGESTCSAAEIQAQTGRIPVV